MNLLKKIISTITSHKILVIVLIAFVALIGSSIGFRSYLLAKLKIGQKDKAGISYAKYAPLPATPSETATPSADASDNSILGTTSSDNSSDQNSYVPPPIPTAMPNPIITVVPIPTNIPIPTSTPTNSSTSTNNTVSSGSNTSSCANSGECCSNAVFPSSPVAIGSNTTVFVDFSACNNSSSYSSDTITVYPSSVDSTFQVVGSGSLPYTLSNGQSSFRVTSQNVGSNTFTIQDTTRGFKITGSNPPYSTPNVTFTGSTSTPTPTPTAASTVTPTATPSPTSTATSSATPSP